MSNQSSRTPREFLSEWLIKARFSFTGVGSALGIAITFILHSFDVFATPTFLIYAAFSVIGGAAGGGVGWLADEIQNYLND